jgi:glycosyltransferase involved in cell wall biosynthesis
MRIAQISPLTEAVPPKLYGGTERVISWLTEELVALGHDVTLFASGDSRTSAQLKAVWPRALRLDESIRDPMGVHMTMLEQVRRQADEFDLMHFHLDYYPFSLFSRQSTSFVTTLHGRLDLPELQPGIFHVCIGADHLDFELAAAPDTAGQLGQDNLPWATCAFTHATACEAELSGVSGAYLTGKIGRPRHPDR